MKSTSQGPPAFIKRREQKSNLGRHKRNCSVCCHPKLAEMEADFISWRSPAAIAKEYGLADRASVYRLFSDEQREIARRAETLLRIRVAEPRKFHLCLWVGVVTRSLGA